MAKKPTEAELQKQEAENKARMRSFLESDDPTKRDSAFKALFKVSAKYDVSPEEALAMINEENHPSG